MIRTKLAKSHISPITLHLASSVRIPSSVNNFNKRFLLLGYLLLVHLLSGSILGHLMCSKDTECILIILSAMSVAHIYVIILTEINYGMQYVGQTG